MAHNPPPTILRPAHKRPAASSSAGRAASNVGGLDRRLRAILQHLGLQAFAPIFQKEKLSVDVLATWDLPTVKAYLPDLPGGPATQLLEHCKVPASAASDIYRVFNFCVPHFSYTIRLIVVLTRNPAQPIRTVVRFQLAY